MPMEGVHAARQMPPGKCDKIRTKDITDGVQFNYCVRGNSASEVESVHFDAKRFTPDEARAWLKKHQFSADQFEPAKPAHAKAEGRPNLTCELMEDVEQCPNGADCPMRKLAQAADEAARNAPPGLPADAGPLEIRASATGTCEIEAQAADPAALPRVNMLAYTGVPMKLDGFHLPVVVDLETLKVPRQKVPILRGHDAERIAGHTDKIDVTAQRLKASGVLSGAPRQTVDVIHLGKNEFPWQVSIGAQTTDRVQHVPAGETAKVNGRVWKGPLLVARNAVLREVSLLPMGADGNTEAGLSAEGGTDLRAAVCDLLAYDPADAAEVGGFLADLRAYSDDQPRDDHGQWASDGGGGSGGGADKGGGSGGDKGGGKGGGKSDEKPPKLTKKDLSKAATAQLQKAAAAEKAGDKQAAKNHRAAAYGYNRAAKHLDDGDKAKAAAVRQAAHEFATGKRSLSAGAVVDIAARPLAGTFCPTGPGGGVDNSCGKGDGGGGAAGNRVATKYKGHDVVIEVGEDGKGKIVQGPKEHLGKTLVKKGGGDKPAAPPKAEAPKPAEPKPAEKPAAKPAEKPPVAPKALASKAEAEQRFDTAHNMSVSKGNGVSESQFLAAASHIDAEHTRLSGEFKAVRDTADARRSNTRLEVGHDYFKDRGQESLSGHFEHSTGIGGNGIVLSSRPQVDSSHVPAVGGFDVGKDLGTIFRHELGHEVYYSSKFSSARKGWDRSMTPHVGTSNVSKYGGTNHSELFAESFAAYTSANYKAGTLPRDIEGFMDRHVRGRR